MIIYGKIPYIGKKPTKVLPDVEDSSQNNTLLSLHSTYYIVVLYLYSELHDNKRVPGIPADY